MTPKPALFELPATPLDEDIVIERLHKSLNWAEELRQRAPQPGKRRLGKPKMWILSKGTPTVNLEDFGLKRDDAWPPGFYHSPPGFNYAVVLIPELQEEAATLVLRLLGSQSTSGKAVEKFRGLADTDADSGPRRERMLMTAS